MRTPYGLEPVESCAACAGRGERPFCGEDEQTLGDDGAALRAARQLGRNYRTAFEQVRLLGLSNSAAGKFARFLLEACERHRAEAGAGDHVKLSLTHEEIGQLIGASRETVTRLFSEFKSGALINVKGATLRVRDRAALEALADG